MTETALTITVIAGIVLIIAAAVTVLIRDRKKRSCTGKCSGCPYCGGCGKNPQ